MSSLRFIIVCNEVQKRDSKTSINSFDYLDPKDNSTLDPINDGSSSDTCSEKELLKKSANVAVQNIKELPVKPVY